MTPAPDLKVLGPDPYEQARQARGEPNDVQMRVLRIAEVSRLVSLNKRTVERMRAAGQFPQPIRLGGNSIGWIESEVIDWIASRPRVP